MSGKRLGVLVDGVPLPVDAAHALWDRFSLWMEEHRGDLAGFAVQEGYLSVHPGVNGDLPILRASKSAVQQPYAAVRDTATSSSSMEKTAQVLPAAGGSAARQGGHRRPDHRGDRPSVSRRKAGK